MLLSCLVSIVLCKAEVQTVPHPKKAERGVTSTLLSVAVCGLSFIYHSSSNVLVCNTVSTLFAWICRYVSILWMVDHNQVIYCADRLTCESIVIGHASSMQWHTHRHNHTLRVCWGGSGKALLLSWPNKSTFRWYCLYMHRHSTQCHTWCDIQRKSSGWQKKW